MRNRVNKISHFKKIAFCFLVLWIFGVTSVMAENADTTRIRTNFVFGGYAQYGDVLATNPYLKQSYSLANATNEFAAISLQLLKQTSGEKIWEQKFGFPQYGIGIYSAHFFNNNQFGTPIAIYGLLKAPFKRWNKLSFNYEGGFGFTFNWEAFNPAENNYNISMGAAESVFIDLGANLTYELGSHFDLGFGYSFTHFSNGALKSPNQGLNTFSPKISLSYRVNRFRPKLLIQPDLAFRKNTSVDFSVFGGAKNVIYKGNDVDTITKYKGVYYPVYGFTTVVNRQVNYKSKLGIGMSLSYDGSYNSTVFVDNGELEPTEGFHGNKLSLSIFPSYELVINKLSVVLQPGFYVLRKQSVNKKPVAYQRLGLHYQISRNLFTGINLRAYNYHISDFIEWTLGYRLTFRKSFK